MRWLRKRHPSALARKMNGLGFRDWPDREVLKPGVVRPLWIEFKRPGEEQTESQAEMSKRLLKRFDHPTAVCVSLTEAQRAYEEHR